MGKYAAVQDLHTNFNSNVYNDSSVFQGVDRRMINIISLTAVIVASLICNTLAILFIIFKDSKTILKDKILILLCVTNCLQTIGYAIGLQAAAERWISEATCVFAAFLLTSLTYSSIGYLVSLTLERYLAIKFPFQHLEWIHGIKLFVWLLFPPLLGVVVGVAPVLGWGGYGKSRETDTYCGFNFRNTSYSAKSYLIFVVVCYLVVPIAVTSSCFGGILHELRHTATKNRRKFGKESMISRDSEKNVTQQYVSSMLTGLVYFMSWVPYGVVCFMHYYQTRVPITFEYIAIYLSKSSTVLSPIIYCLIEKQFYVFVRKQYRYKQKDAVTEIT